MLAAVEAPLAADALVPDDQLFVAALDAVGGIQSARIAAPEPVRTDQRRVPQPNSGQAKAAQRSTVLLKNERALLPLDRLAIACLKYMLTGGP